MLSGDDLSIQLFIAALAVSAWSIAVTQAGWTQKHFIRGLFISGGALAITAVLWGPLSKHVPRLDLLAIVATSPWAWLLLLMMGFGAISWIDLKARESWAAKFPALVEALQTKASPAVVSSPVKKWFSPLDAVDEFADREIVRNALQALAAMKSAREEYVQAVAAVPKETDSDPVAAINRALNPIPDRIQELSRKADEAEIAYSAARYKVFSNLSDQLKHGILVARGLPFDSKKLDGDWEVIKSAYWSVLTFSDHGDRKMETVTGGERTYKGLQIGKPEAQT